MQTILGDMIRKRYVGSQLGSAAGRGRLYRSMCTLGMLGRYSGHNVLWFTEHDNSFSKSRVELLSSEVIAPQLRNVHVEWSR